MSLFTLVPILGLAFWIYQTGFSRVSMALFVSVTAIITVVSLLFVAGYGVEGVIAIYILGTIGMTVSLIIRREQWQVMATSVPFVIFIMLSIMYWFVSREAHFFYWDEFSHWGFYFKELMLTGHLYDANSLMAHRDYPPGSAVWQYFVAYFSTYDEGDAYFANVILIFAAISVFYERLRWDQPLWIAVIMALSALFLADFGHGFNKIYVDHIISILFIGIIAQAVTATLTGRLIVLFVFPLMALVLYKGIGLYFAAASLGFLLVVVAMSRNENEKWNVFLQRNKNLFFGLVIVGLVSFSVQGIWSKHLDTVGIPAPKQSIEGIVTSWIKGESALDAKGQMVLEERFFDVFFHQQIAKDEVSERYNEFSYATMDQYSATLRLTTFSMLLFYLILIAGLCWMHQDGDRRKIVVYGLYMLIVAGVYMIIVYYSYFVAFGQSAVRIPSYVRYMNTAVMPMFFMLLLLLIPAFAVGRKNEKLVAAGVFTLVLYVMETPNLKSLYIPNTVHPISESLEPLITSLEKKVENGKKVFVVFPVRQNGFYSVVMQYRMFPMRARVSDQQFVQKNRDEVAKIFSKYDYIWFPVQDSNLHAYYRNLLGTETLYSLYRVELGTSGVRLIPVS